MKYRRKVTWESTTVPKMIGTATLRVNLRREGLVRPDKRGDAPAEHSYAKSDSETGTYGVAITTAIAKSGGRTL
jgi:hypothetical protein